MKSNLSFEEEIVLTLPILEPKGFPLRFLINFVDNDRKFEKI